MARIKMDVKGNPFGIEGNTSFEAEGGDNLVAGAFRDFAGILTGKPEQVKVIAEPEQQPVAGAVWDVVAIYDNAGIPSIMHRFRRTTNAELFGGSGKTHPAFIIGGEEYDEIYISVYPNCEINGKPYSLPYMEPWTEITNDEAAKACFSKGYGWHLLTAPEWGLLANISLKNGTLPHGNTNYGKYHADSSETGKTCKDSSKTLTGSGPATWTHDHTTTGVHDLCGNVWELIRGARLKNGRLQAAKNNDAALDIDLSPEGDGWQPVTDDTGKQVLLIATDDEDVLFTVNPDMEHDNYTGSQWQDVRMECESEQLKELALFAGEPEAYIYVDSSDGEYFLFRGGGWLSGACAGVFISGFDLARSISDRSVGFRSAYFMKH